MGSGVAASLLRAGHEVTVYNRSPEKGPALSSADARIATRIADACKSAAVFTMLADDGAKKRIALAV
jgi:3-hydroxyisobutyrate dehydrogenase-like beta-hydroxyacid dehydrogenase